MAKQHYSLQVFVGSPSDVKDERIALEEVIEELNNTWSDTYGIRLDLIKWETHTSPEMSEDAMTAVFEQIPNTYDIFIAIFGNRLGTPTKRAKSGTIEEFNRTYERYKTDPNSVEIMVYFKEALIRPSQIDTDQVKEIQAFKSDIKERGLYFDFDSTDSFKKLVRGHLNQKIKKLAKRYGGNPPPPIALNTAIKEEIQPTNIFIEEVEIVEKIEKSSYLIERVKFTLNHIVNVIENLSKKLSRKNTNNKKHKKKTEPFMNEKEISMIMINTSHFLTDFVYRMSYEVPLFEKSLRMALEPYINIYGRRKEFFNENSDIIQNALIAFSTFRAETLKANIIVKNFRKFIERFLSKKPESENTFPNAVESIDILLHHIEYSTKDAARVETILTELI